MYQTIEQSQTSAGSGTNSASSVTNGQQESVPKNRRSADWDTTKTRGGLDEHNPMCINSVAIRPIAGEVLWSNQPVRVEVSYRSLIPMDDSFTWGFSLLTADQLITAARAIELVENPNNRIIRGLGRLSCLIRRLPLVAGQYGLTAAILNLRTRRSRARIGYEDPPTVFRVSAEPSELNNFQTMRGELILLNVNWADASARTDESWSHVAHQHLVRPVQPRSPNLRESILRDIEAASRSVSDVLVIIKRTIVPMSLNEDS